MATNVSVMAIASLLIWVVGPVSFFLVHPPIVLLAGSVGVWLFYVQHQFEETHWPKGKDWEFPKAALNGAHHFGDLSGLLTELAASGLIRLRESVEGGAVDAEPSDYLVALGRGYIQFYTAASGYLSFDVLIGKTELSAPSLSAAGPATFSVLSRGGLSEQGAFAALATLIIDGRLGAMADKVQGANLEQLIDGVLT